MRERQQRWRVVGRRIVLCCCQLSAILAVVWSTRHLPCRPFQLPSPPHPRLPPSLAPSPSPLPSPLSSPSILSFVDVICACMVTHAAPGRTGWSHKQWRAAPRLALDLGQQQCACVFVVPTTPTVHCQHSPHFEQHPAVFDVRWGAGPTSAHAAAPHARPQHLHPSLGLASASSLSLCCSSGRHQLGLRRSGRACGRAAPRPGLCSCWPSPCWVPRQRQAMWC